MSAYVGWTLNTNYGVSFTACICIGCLTGAVLGSGIYLGVYWPLRQKNSPQFIYLLASFAVFVFFSGLLQLIFGGDIQTFQGFTVKKGHSIAGAIVTATSLSLSERSSSRPQACPSGLRERVWVSQFELHRMTFWLPPSWASIRGE